MSDLPLLLYRAPTAEDVPFLLNSFLSSQRHVQPFQYVSQEEFYDVHGAFFKQLLSSPDINVLVIANPEDSTHIYGYAVYEYLSYAFILHYLYIKQPYRRMGIAKHTLKLINPNFGVEPTILTHVDRPIGKISKQDNKSVKNASAFVCTRNKYKLRYSLHQLAASISHLKSKGK